MTPSVYYFEIPVSDIDRATQFYNSVFGCSFERVSIDGNEMANFPMPKNGTGAYGALTKGASYKPGKSGVRVYFEVPDITAILGKAVKAGGSINYPKTSIGELGWVAEFVDSEGNVIALTQPLNSK